LSHLAGARWVLLRGLAREAGHWGSFPDVLRRTLPEAQILRPDLPGCGLAADATSPDTVPEILERVRERLGLPRPAREGEPPLAALGISLGGMLVVEWLARHPGELTGAVIVNASVGGLSPPWRRLRPLGLWHLAGAALARTPARREAHVYAMVSARPAAAGPVVESWVALGASHPIQTATAWRQIVAAARYRPRVLPHPGAALVLVSANDGMVDPACSRALAATMGVPVREHPTAGHDLPLDEPEWTANEIAAWIGAATGGVQK
jgi:pimeloyl-ACP methyl ester carboxylesterase